MTEPLTTGTLEHISPNDLLIETNVRTEASLTKQFIASIQENGVLVPITAIRDTNGVVHVRAGQRRTLAAREAGLATVPVYITDAGDDVETRVVQQLTENDQRLSMTAKDRVMGIQQLLDTGMSITKVSKRLAVSADRVKQSQQVATSDVAMEALHSRTVTLEQAAALAEFEDEDGAVERLLRAAERGFFDHEAERLRNQRVERAARAKAAVAYEELGYTVLTEWPRYDGVHVPLRHLVYTDGTGESREADESDVITASHWAIMLVEEPVFTGAIGSDREGETIAEELIDWATETDPESEAAEGLLHYRSITESSEWVPSEYFCLNPEGAGLTVAERYQKLAAANGSLPDGIEAEESEEEIAAAKAARREVLSMNKLGLAAESVRRDFVKTMLARKTLPEGGGRFMAEAMIGGLWQQGHGDEVAGELLGGPVRDGQLLDHATDSRAQVIVLGMVLGSMELFTGKSAWRGPSDSTVKYLRFLAANGYLLSPVEQVMVGDITVDACMEMQE